MHDSIKHATGTAVAVSGFFGSITLHQISDLVSIGSGLLGGIAAVYTIYSIYRNRHRKKRHD